VSQPPLVVLHANDNGLVVFLMEMRVRWSVSLTSNAYYWWSYDDLGEESMNRIPPQKKIILHFSGIKRWGQSVCMNVGYCQVQVL
jgi:hypothetical protein